MKATSRVARSFLLTVMLLSLGAIPIAPGVVAAATITVENIDGANEGFNDPRPRTTVGGNSGTTLGQQRFNVIQRAATIWGELLQSDVEIVIRASFDPLDCGPTTGILGQAGAVAVVSDFPGAEVPNTWYVVALANAMSQTDLRPQLHDLGMTFNSSVGFSCLTQIQWYYGFDMAPDDERSLLTVALHEIGHGLGFASITSASTGLFLDDIPDIYNRFLFDNDQQKYWDEMTNAERAASAVNDLKVVWTGPEGILAAEATLGGPTSLIVNSPPSVAGIINGPSSEFGPAFSREGVTGQLVLFDDGDGVLTDACADAVNGAALAGNIAFVDRGGCAFTDKVKRAQDAGAIGVVIGSNLPGTLRPPGEDSSIVIPSLMIGLNQANDLKAAIDQGAVNVTLALDPTQKEGADEQGRPFIYTPSVLAPGSSVSHWDTSARPNLLMEPFITTDITPGQVDMTLAVYQDIGWKLPVVAIAGLVDAGAHRVGNGVEVWWQWSHARAADDVRVLRGSHPIDASVREVAGRFTLVDTAAPQAATEYWVVSETSGERQGPLTVAAAPSVSVSLAPAHPNPFVRDTVVSFTLAEASPVEVSILDVRGRRVRRLVSGSRESGTHRVVWSGRDDSGLATSAGLYFVHLDAGGRRFVRKIVRLE